MQLSKTQTNLIIQALRIYKEEIDLAAHAVLSSALKKQWREDSDVIERLIRDFTVDTTELETGILAHLNAGNVINAIKFVREKTNMPLREAKDHVEEIGVKHNLRVYINGAYHWKHSTW